MPQRGAKGTKKYMKHFVLLCAFLCTSAAAVNGATLFGKVIEVNSGDVITIFNLNRPVRVRLLGVDAPELDQTFGDVAKKHLEDLVYNKSVLVEYAGISADHSLNGRVLLEGADIGAQMIRDGAAWVDPSSHDRLSATDREVYEQSELAARLEGRGLWQQDNPVAPWEFVKAKTFQRTHVAASSNESLSVRTPAPDRPTPELNSLTLMASRIAAAAPASARNLDGILPPVDGGAWHVLRPSRENFSVLVPEEGDQATIPIPGGDRMIDAHAYRGRDGRSAFGVSWFSAPTYGEPDVYAIKATLASLLRGFGDAFQRLHPGQPGFSCELQNEKDISMRGFAGLEFDLTSCTIPARARVFTRVTSSGERQMYVATVFYMDQDDNVSRFLNSFKITSTAESKSRKR